MTLLEEIKAHFIFSMQLSNQEGVFSKEDHRTVILLFIMGWLAATAKYSDNNYDETKEVCEPVCSDPNWLPDSSWNWWGSPERN